MAASANAFARENLTPLNTDSSNTKLYETSLKTYNQVLDFRIGKNLMTHQIFTDMAASISELKANPMKVVASGEGMPVAILNRNEPAFYCVPSAAYEAMMDLIDDIELLKIVKDRQHELSVKVDLDEL